MAAANGVERIHGFIVHNEDGTTDLVKIGGEDCSVVVLIWEQDWGKVQDALNKLCERIGEFATANRQGRRQRIMALQHDGNCNWTPR